jgi:hypothetical protein
MNPELQGGDFDLYSDRKVRKFSQYDLVGPDLFLKPKETCPVTSIEDLKATMLSKDTSKFSELKDMVETCKFLDGKTKNSGVAFVSYPRTGNSFLRKILESVTGVFTGTDMNLAMTLDHQQYGMLGE